MHQTLLLSVLLSQFSNSVSQNHVYHFIGKSKSWSEAQKYCKEYYTDLATVNDTTNLERLKEVANGRAVWIGLHQNSDSVLDRKWHWSQPGVKYNKSDEKWRQSPNEPTNGTKENCLVINDLCQWIDKGCLNTHCFICYDEKSNTTPLIANKTQWLEAQRFCRTHHTDLISGRDQLNMIDTTMLGQCDELWVGLFRDTWGWSDGSDSSVRVWSEWEKILHKDAPANIPKKCATLGKTGKLELESCDETHSFICYDACFILVNQNKTWEKAMYHCRHHYRDLAWFNYPHLQKMVEKRAKMADSEVVWVGLHYTCFLEEWIWVNGHFVDADDVNWKKPGNNDCGVNGAMERKGGNKWVKRRSEEEHNFICARYC